MPSNLCLGGKRISRKKLIRCMMPVVAASLGCAQFAAAAAATWDGTAAIGTPGDGTSWSSAANWTTGGVIDALPSNTAPGDDLTFGGGTVGTISLGGNRVANSLNFTAGFTLDPAANTDTLTLGTATVSVSTGVTAAIDAKIADSHGLTLAGAGTLTLGNANSINGFSNVSGGTLIVGAAGALGTSSASVSASGAIVFNANASFGVVTTNNGHFTVSGGDTVSMTSFSASFLQQAGQLTVTGVLNIGGSPFVYSGGNVTGTVTMGSTSFNPTLTIDTTAGNSGIFALGGVGENLASNTTTVSIQSNQTLLYTPTTATAVLSTLGDPLLNSGAITLTGSSTFGASLSAGTNSITNSGMLTTAVTTSTTNIADFITANQYTNTGTTSINASTRFIASITNSGAFDIASGASIAFPNPANGFTQNAGSLNVAANDTLNFADNSVVLNGGSITLAAAGASGSTPASIVLHSLTYNGSNTTGTIQSGTVGVGQQPGFVDLGATTATFNIGAGTAASQVIISAPITDGALVKTGSGVLILSGNNTLGEMDVTQGTLVAGAANAIPATGGIVIETGATVKLTPGIGGVTTRFISVLANSQLDLTNNHLFIDYADSADPISSIQEDLANGYNGGAWNGHGIMTSSLAPGYGIGYADSADPGNPAGLQSGQIEIKYTLLGDVNLDGAVNGVDFGILAADFNKGLTGWDTGDFNYDEAVNGVDFGFLATNFNKGASGAAADASPADWAALQQFAAANGLLADVPEPATGALIASAGAGLLARRRCTRICKSARGA
jgi:autotransporter-associated beta strand protein